MSDMTYALERKFRAGAENDTLSVSCENGVPQKQNAGPQEEKPGPQMPNPRYKYVLGYQGIYISYHIYLTHIPNISQLHIYIYISLSREIKHIIQSQIHLKYVPNLNSQTYLTYIPSASHTSTF